jgi:hypothetical protein
MIWKVGPDGPSKRQIGIDIRILPNEIIIQKILENIIVNFLIIWKGVPIENFIL